MNNKYLLIIRIFAREYQKLTNFLFQLGQKPYLYDITRYMILRLIKVKRKTYLPILHLFEKFSHTI